MKRAAWAVAVGWAVVLVYGGALLAFSGGSQRPLPPTSWLFGMWWLDRKGLRLAVTGILPLVLLGWNQRAPAGLAPRSWSLWPLAGAVFVLGVAWTLIGATGGVLQPFACEVGGPQPSAAWNNCDDRFDAMVFALNGMLGVAFLVLLKRRFGPVAQWEIGRLVVFSIVAMWATWPWLAMLRLLWWLAYKSQGWGGEHGRPPFEGYVAPHALIWATAAVLQLVVGYWIARRRPDLRPLRVFVIVAAAGPLIAFLVASSPMRSEFVIPSAFPPLVLLGLLVGAALVKLSRRGALAG